MAQKCCQVNGTPYYHQSRTHSIQVFQLSVTAQQTTLKHSNLNNLLLSLLILQADRAHLESTNSKTYRWLQIFWQLKMVSFEASTGLDVTQLFTPKAGTSAGLDKTDRSYLSPQDVSLSTGYLSITNLGFLTA